MSHRISAASRPSSAVFFNGLIIGLLELEIADVLGNGDQLLDQVAKTMILAQLRAGLFDGFALRDHVCDRLAGDGMRQ